jgi:uncharacterized protein (TIGR00304 family)
VLLGWREKVDITDFYTLGVALVVVGIIIVVVVIVLSSAGGSKKGKVQGAGVIMIGPIPIIFGTDKKSVKTVVALALALTIVVLIITVVYYWLLR